jgi:hypothetical protein
MGYCDDGGTSVNPGDPSEWAACRAGLVLWKKSFWILLYGHAHLGVGAVMLRDRSKFVDLRLLGKASEKGVYGAVRPVAGRASNASLGKPFIRVGAATRWLASGRLRPRTYYFPGFIPAERPR